MKEEKKERFDFKFLNTVMYIGAIIGIYYVLKNIGLMDKIIEALFSLMPVYIGFLVCWISMPLAHKLKKLGLNKTVSAFVSLIIIFGVLIVIFSFVIPIFVSELTNLIKEFPSLYTTVIEKINWIMTQKLHLEKGLEISTNLKDVAIVEKVQNNLGSIVNYSITTIQSVLGVLVTIGTAIVVSFFMVKDVDRFKSNIISFFSKNKKNTNRYKMILEIDETLMSYIKGMAIDSFIVGVLTTIVCMILGLDYAVVFGFLIMILNLIPYIGAILSYTIASLYALTVGGPILGLITLICLVAVQVIDANILQPNIVAKSVNLHPVVVLAGLIVFEVFFGIFGMIIAVPVLAVIKIILKYKFSVNFEEFEKEQEVKEKEKSKIKILNNKD